MPASRNVFALLKETGQEVIEDNCMSLSAAIAYSALFSLPPLLVIVVAIAGAVFGADAVQQQITDQMGGLVGAEGAQEIEVMIRNASDLGGSLGGKIIGFIALLVGATGAFGQIQAALNRAWEVKPDPDKGGVKNYILKRILSFGVVLTIAFLLLASLALSAALAALGTGVESVLGEGLGFVAHVLNFIVSFGLVTLLFAAVFKMLPDAEVAWRDVWVGAAVTSLLFTIGKTVIGLYLGNSDVGSAFGAAGSLVVILVWIYYTALILLAGAEFTQVWATHYGSRITPDEDAVRVVETEHIVKSDGSSRVTESDAGSGTGTTPRKTAPGSEARDTGAETEKVDRPYVHPREPAPREGWNPESPKDEG